MIYYRKAGLKIEPKDKNTDVIIYGHNNPSIIIDLEAGE